MPNLRDADLMLNAGQDLAAVLRSLVVSEQTYYRLRNQYGGLYLRIGCTRRTGPSQRSIEDL